MKFKCIIETEINEDLIKREVDESSVQDQPERQPMRKSSTAEGEPPVQQSIVNSAPIIDGRIKIENSSFEHQHPAVDNSAPVQADKDEEPSVDPTLEDLPLVGKPPTKKALMRKTKAQLVEMVRKSYKQAREIEGKLKEAKKQRVENDQTTNLDKTKRNNEGKTPLFKPRGDGTFSFWIERSDGSWVREQRVENDQTTDIDNNEEKPPPFCPYDNGKFRFWMDRGDGSWYRERLINLEE